MPFIAKITLSNLWNNFGSSSGDSFQKSLFVHKIKVIKPSRYVNFVKIPKAFEFTAAIIVNFVLQGLVLATRRLNKFFVLKPF